VYGGKRKIRGGLELRGGALERVLRWGRTFFITKQNPGELWKSIGGTTSERSFSQPMPDLLGWGVWDWEDEVKEGIKV